MSGLQTILGTPVTLLRNTTGTASVSCPAGLKVIAGGFSTSVPAGSSAGAADLQVFISIPSGAAGWSASGKNNASGSNGNNGNGNNGNNVTLTLQAYALCAVVQ
jgi:hypothetical protein